MFADYFPKQIAYAFLKKDEITSPLSQLNLQEFHLVSSYRSIKRQEEFALGRLAAHRALKQITGTCDTEVEFKPILQGSRGEPLWPKDIVGSISHSSTADSLSIGTSSAYAAATVARVTDASAIGLDLQLLDHVPSRKLAKRICTVSEQTWCEKEALFFERRLLGIFSAKEAVFKALYPPTQRYFGFQEATLEVEMARENFSRYRGVLNVSLDERFRKGFQFTVEQRIRGSLMLSVLALSPSLNPLAFPDCL